MKSLLFINSSLDIDKFFLYIYQIEFTMFFNVHESHQKLLYTEAKQTFFQSSFSFSGYAYFLLQHPQQKKQQGQLNPQQRRKQQQVLIIIQSLMKAIKRTIAKATLAYLVIGSVSK